MEPVAEATPNPDMQAVLDELSEFGAPPIPEMQARNARAVPLPADAVQSLLAEREGSAPPPAAVGGIEHRLIPLPNAEGDLLVRILTPEGEGPFPVIVYYHGGGWVIASVSAYDASSRALTNAAQCMVVSVAYRMAPEHKLPAAHEDSYAATQWVMKHAAAWGGDPRRVAVGGESAGGNLATAVCLMARHRKGMMPIHQLLVYPITNYGFNTRSYWENARAKPLNRAMMMWFFRQALKNSAQGRNPYISPLRANVKGLPPATVVLAEIDPLRSEGAAYAERLRNAGVPVRLRLYHGVTHEFFGMGAVVDKAKQAVAFAAGDLRSAFMK